MLSAGANRPARLQNPYHGRTHPGVRAARRPHPSWRAGAPSMCRAIRTRAISLPTEVGGVCPISAKFGSQAGQERPSRGCHCSPNDGTRDGYMAEWRPSRGPRALDGAHTRGCQRYLSAYVRKRGEFRHPRGALSPRTGATQSLIHVPSSVMPQPTGRDLHGCYARRRVCRP